MNNKILIIDIETTGFINVGKIVEVGIVSLDLKNNDIKVLLDYVTYEDGITEQEIKDSWIIRNSNLTLEQIKYSLNFKYLKPKIQKILNDHPGGATAFNKKFDFGFLRDRGITIPKELPCPMLEATNVCKISKKRRVPGYKWPKVEEAYKFFYPDEPYVEKHRGADDAIHEAKIVYALHKLNGTYEDN